MTTDSLRAALEQAQQLADGEAVDAYILLEAAVRAHLQETDDADDSYIEGVRGWCHACGRDILSAADHADGCAQSGYGPDHPQIRPMP